VGRLARARAHFLSVTRTESIMEIILRQAVENLGKPGDVVKVKSGYARNYLLPHGLAYEATPGNLKRIQQERDRLEAAENDRRGAAQTIAERLEQVSLTFSARVGEEGKLFGSVGAADIAQQLEAQGFHIEKRQIDLHEPIKSLGVYRVPVRLHADVKPEVRVWVIKQ
jgi:large subunit ribosomal protein L9